MNRVWFLLLMVLLIPTTIYADDVVPIREYLVQKGYANEQITYDTARKMVLLNSRDFYRTIPMEDSKTYASRSTIDRMIAYHKSGRYMVYMDAPIMMIQ